MFAICFLLSTTAAAARLKSNDFPWIKSPIAAGASELQICGSHKIVPTKKSVRRHFYVGSSERGYFATGLISIERYFQILTDYRLDDAKNEISKAFANAELWTVQKGQTEAVSMGKPRRIELRFTATVKDCIEGARTSLGNDCSKNSGTNLAACCREKFTGPEIIWGEKFDHRLHFFRPT